MMTAAMVVSLLAIVIEFVIVYYVDTHLLKLTKEGVTSVKREGTKWMLGKIYKINVI